jgi:electron transport complex protein RnfB
MPDSKYIDRIDALLPRESSPLAVARIDETACIGCTLCIAACPVEAIVGATKLMHTVLAEQCIGCELCLPPCPANCIAMVAAGRTWTRSDAARTRERFARRKERLTSRDGGVKPQAASDAGAGDADKLRRQAAVAAALARARQRRAQHSRRPR